MERMIRAILGRFVVLGLVAVLVGCGSDTPNENSGNSDSNGEGVEPTQLAEAECDVDVECENVHPDDHQKCVDAVAGMGQTARQQGLQCWTAWKEWHNCRVGLGCGSYVDELGEPTICEEEVEAVQEQCDGEVVRTRCPGDEFLLVDGRCHPTCEEDGDCSDGDYCAETTGDSNVCYPED